MFQDKYRKMMEQIVPDEAVVENVLLEIEEQEYRNNRKHGETWKRLGKTAVSLAAGICAVIFLLSCSLTALAGNHVGAYELLYLLSPKAAQFFMPVQKVSEKNGIRMEVISAYIHEQTAEIYIAMEDLEGDRIDESTDLYDSYSIHRPFPAMGSCRKAEYDPESGRVLFLITVSEWGKQNIEGEKMTFSVREFMSHQTEYEYLPMVGDLTTADREPEMADRFLDGVGRGREQQEGDTLIDRNTLKVLPPGEGAPIEMTDENGQRVTVEGIELSGMAYTDGMLHVQIKIKNMFDNDNHGFIYLRNKQGKELDYYYHVSYQEQEADGSTTGYQEFTFQVTEEELGDYGMIGHFWVTGNHTKGPWQVVFPLEKEKQK